MIQLSYSSSNLVLNCQQKYVHYKVDKVDKDSDFVDSNALKIGSAFHKCLEDTKHVLKGFTPANLKLVVEDHELDFEEHGPLLFAMLAKYKDLHEASGLVCDRVETKLDDKNLLGYVDVHMIDEKSGELWITDVKTAANISGSLKKRLSQDRQLNLYVSRSLDCGPIAGSKMRVVSKPKLKRKADEKFGAYFKRLYKSCKAHEYTVRREDMEPEKAYEDHVDLAKIARSLHKGKKPTRNYSFCESFFRPCEYWSKCHGGREFSDETKIELLEV
tara:strand:+ start:181 stop:999 length:819 start_codon:yes stop_codon:yes gene_type:complete